MTKSAVKVGIGLLALSLASPWSAVAEGRADASAQGSASGSVQADRPTTQLAAGSSVHAVLDGKLDARRAKVGDSVKARIARAVKSGSGVVIPRGAKLMGRVS